MTITDTPIVRDGEQLVHPQTADVAVLPRQIINPTSEPTPVAQVGTALIEWRLPHFAYTCTRRDHATTCVGQVLAVSERRPDGTEWWSTTIGVCQNSQHRQRVYSEYRTQHDYPGSTYIPEETHGLWARFPSVAPGTVIPDPVDPTVEDHTVALPRHTRLQREMLAYLLGGEGTVDVRHQAFTVLAEHGVFNPSREESEIRGIIHGLLDDDALPGCSEGIERFLHRFGLGRTARFSGELLNNGEVIATFIFQADTDDPELARDQLDLPLAEIDSALRRALYNFDRHTCSIDFAAEIDTSVENVTFVEWVR